jgi:glycosyltransferase involved in cell wall biosynthesis
MQPGERTGGLLFVGRISVEKGADLLLRIAPHVSGGIDIVGDGPDVKLFAAPPGNVKMHGWLPHDQVLEMMRRAAALVVPSRWYEGFPMVIAEALATGTPVLVSALGALPDLVEGGQAGFAIAPNDESAWIEAANAMIEQPHLRARLGAAGRAAYLRTHALEPNMAQLAMIYHQAIARRDPSPAKAGSRAKTAEC